MKTTLLLCAAAACVGLAYSDDTVKSGLPEGEGKDKVIRACTDCHNTDNIRKKRLKQ